MCRWRSRIRVVCIGGWTRAVFVRLGLPARGHGRHERVGRVSHGNVAVGNRERVAEARPGAGGGDLEQRHLSQIGSHRFHHLRVYGEIPGHRPVLPAHRKVGLEQRRQSRSAECRIEKHGRSLIKAVGREISSPDRKNGGVLRRSRRHSRKKECGDSGEYNTSYLHRFHSDPISGTRSGIRPDCTPASGSGRSAIVMPTLGQTLS